MNAEQLNGILSRLADSHRTLQTIEKLAAVRTSLEAVAGNPAEASLQEQFRKQLQTLRDTLGLPQLNTFSVREAKLIEDLNLDLLVGEHMRERLSDAMVGSAITPRSAFDAVVKLHDRANATLKKIQKVSSGLTELGIDVGGPEAGIVELGLYIPRHGENLSLEQILEEGADLDALIKLAYEVVEGKSHSPEVAYLTSSDYGYLLHVVPNVVRFLLDIVEKGLNIRKKWAEDRETFKRSRELGHDEETLKTLEEKQKGKRETELEDVIRISIEEQNGPDVHRKNEITMPMTKGIKLLLEKHESGSYIDIRVGGDDDDETPDEQEGELPELKELRKRLTVLREIEQISQRIHLLERQREPQMASLPAPDKN